ncbi:MAG TPA: hypothetical protein VNO30_22285 [Kofleriaceae bacterium]|nr:hypothetical protein [Kofleriaceae bacterium]
MRNFRGELLAALAVISAATGTALAQGPDNPNPSQPIINDPTQPSTNDPANPTNTDVTPAPVQAQTAPAPTTVIVSPPPPAPIITYERQPGTMDSMKRVGFSLSFGGGVADFTDQSMRDSTGTGGTWAVRAALGTKTPFGVEASYIGSAQTINALGLDQNSMLVSNGLQGALRLNAVVGAPITPFVFGGVAWNRYNLANTTQNTSAISDSDNLLEVPVGLGIGGSWKGLGYDLRGELRFATREDLVPALSAGRDNGSHADMHRWGVNATLGYGF